MSLRIPNFNAERAVYTAHRSYWTAQSFAAGASASQAAVAASQFGPIFDPTCPGSTERCVSIFCAGLTGAKRAQCIVTCNESPVCSACDCRCDSNCVRTCKQRCCRTTIGPPFRQICCTRGCFKFPDEATQADITPGVAN